MANGTPGAWRSRMGSSVLIGALVVAVWMVVVLISGWPVDTTENLSGLLNAALNNLLNLSVVEPPRVRERTR